MTNNPKKLEALKDAGLPVSGENHYGAINQSSMRNICKQKFNVLVIWRKKGLIQMTNHEFYMNLALENARAMKGQTDPNPLVGSVIVNDNRIVGIGTHLKAGEPHAEIHAIRMAGEKAKGGTIYVTLEPCSHYGRTGPCAVAIVEAGIKKVVIATLDPNPVVAGNGVKILEDAGIEVIVGVMEEQSRKMNEVFNKFIVEQEAIHDDESWKHIGRKNCYTYCRQ